MSRLKVASVCPRMAPSEPLRNMAAIDQWSHKAAASGADLVVFPEMFLTGYTEEWMVRDSHVDRERFLSLSESSPGPMTDRLVALSHSLGIYICVGLLELHEGRRYISQVMVDPSKGLLGCYRKVQVDVSERWFSEPGNDYPVFEILGVAIGIMICRDKSHPEVARILALQGAELFLVPHAFAETPGQRFLTWSLRICQVRAMENGCYLIANNCIFDSLMRAGRQHAGYTFAIDPYGEVIHCDEGSGDAEKMAVITVDTDIVSERRRWEGESFNLWSRRPEAYLRLVEEQSPATRQRF